jgi:hypothetical protein
MAMLAALAVVFGLAPSSPLQVPDPIRQQMQNSLKGVGEISIVAHFAPDATTKERLKGLDTDPMLIVQRAERTLRKGHLAADPIFTEQHPANLIVQLHIECSSVTPSCAVGTRVILNQWAIVRGREMPAATWHAEHTTIMEFEQIRNMFFQGLDEILDQFVSDYQAVNKLGHHHP